VRTAGAEMRFCGSMRPFARVVCRLVAGCDDPSALGMITGRVGDSQITSSSVYPADWDADCAERYARVYQPDRRAWCAKHKSASEWLQVDLGVASKVVLARVSHL